MTQQLSVLFAVTAFAWLAPAEVEAQQQCQGNVDCDSGWVCASKRCVQEGVTGQAWAGSPGLQLGLGEGDQEGEGQEGGVTGQVASLGVPVVEEPEPQPVEYYRESVRPLWSPIGPLVGFLWGWVVHGAGSGVGSMQMRDRGNPIADDFFSMGLVPVAGPWIQLGILEDAGYDDGGWVAGTVFSGLLQAGLLMLTILPFVLPRPRVAVRADLGNGVDLAVSPGIGSLSASLTF